MLIGITATSTTSSIFFWDNNLATTEELSAISWERQGITKEEDGHPTKKGLQAKPCNLVISLVAGMNL